MLLRLYLTTSKRNDLYICSKSWYNCRRPGAQRIKLAWIYLVFTTYNQKIFFLILPNIVQQQWYINFQHYIFLILHDTVVMGLVTQKVQMLKNI